MIAIEQEIPFTIIPSRNTRSSTLSAITISDDFFDDCDISLLDNNEKEQQYYDIRSTSIDEYEEEEGDLQAVQRNSALSRFSSASNNTSGPMHKPERQRSVILMASNMPRRGSSAESYLDNIPNLPSRRPSELLMEIRQQSGSDRSLLAPSTSPNFKNMMPPMKPARQHTKG